MRSPLCNSPVTHLRRTAAVRSRLGLLVAAAACVLLASAPAALAGTLERGIHDETILWTRTGGSTVVASPQARKAALDDLVALHVQTVRLNFFWDIAEPSRGQYNESYIDAYKTALTDAHDRGLKIMLAVYGTPRWASGSALWSNPALPHDTKGYHSYFAPALNKMGAWQATARYLASSFGDLVTYWECWNEPNLWAYLYPQRTAKDALFAARRYAVMLQHFYTGIKAGDPSAIVLGGVTAPVGNNDKLRTSPQRFAAALRRLGAAANMDGYSHHAYVPGGVTTMLPPQAPPRFPSSTVSLGNIGTLLHIFPSKPFYITEYGYTTRYSQAFGGGQVSPKTQAAYLTAAFHWAARFKQIKMLVWFLRQDWSPSGKATDRTGIYFGLRDIHGLKKPSWSAYAKFGR
jgi:hypothetical protein